MLNESRFQRPIEQLVWWVIRKGSKQPRVKREGINIGKISCPELRVSAKLSFHWNRMYHNWSRFYRSIKSRKSKFLKQTQVFHDQNLYNHLCQRWWHNRRLEFNGSASSGLRVNVEPKIVHLHPYCARACASKSRSRQSCDSKLRNHAHQHWSSGGFCSTK